MEDAVFDAGASFDENGDFNDAGKASLVALAGADHTETKVFDDITNMGGLAKAFADTKSAYGKKLENVIQRPADDADETVKANYRLDLAKAAGAPDDAAGYEMFKPETLPEGMTWSDDLEAGYRALFAELKVPKDTALALSKHFAESAIANFTSLMDGDKKAQAEKADAEQREFDEGCAKLRTENPGDKLPEYTRRALAAINKYSSTELQGKLKEAKMYENAIDLAKWRESGVPLATLAIFERIGKDMEDAPTLGNKGKSIDGKKDMYPNTKG